MFSHSGQLAGHLYIIYLWGCLQCCPHRHLGSSETWCGLRMQESVLTTYPIRNEKRIIYHKHSVFCRCFLFVCLWFVWFWWWFWVVFVVDCFFYFPPLQTQGHSHLFFVICGITSSVKQEMVPMSELAWNASWCYSNLSVVCLSQSCVRHDEMWCGKSYASNAQGTERSKYWACSWPVSLCKVEHQGKAGLAARTWSFQDSSGTTLDI